MQAEQKMLFTHSSSCWSQEEEKVVKRIVEVDGTRNWESVAQTLAKETGKTLRTGKQCRQRYMNFIKFGDEREELLKWTIFQKNKLFSLYLQWGSKWASIAQHFQTKSENCVKNKFYGCIRKLARKLNKAGKSGKIIKKSLRFQSVLKVLEFDEDLFTEKFGSRLTLLELKGIILKTAQQQISELADTDAHELIRQINKFNLLTRSSHPRKTNSKNKRKELTPLITSRFSRGLI